MNWQSKYQKNPLKDYRLIHVDTANNEAWCRHLIWCKSTECNKCRRKRKDQVMAILG